MVKFVKKRNGSIEKFDPTKLNQWAEWAANKNVGWSDVLLEAIRSLPETAKSEDIQTALINSCVNRGYSQMAARLLLGQIFKEAYGGFNIPSFKSFYKNAVTMGYWGDFGYSDEELDYIDSFIDHPKDFEYEYCTVRQFYDKYAVSAHGVCLESPQMALMATAVSNTRHEPDRHIRAVAAYKELSNLKINLPTPSLAGQRTPVSGSPSCCVITGGDSVDSIEAAVHVAYKMTAMGSGIGAELSTRSKKDPVKGGTIEHMGKDSYYRYLDRAVKANKQHTRGGSATVTFHVHDPEIDMLLRYKSQRILESQRIDTMDYSLAVTKLFMKKAATDDMWMLVSNFFAPKLYELSYRANEEEYEEEYNRVLEDTSVKKTMVKAREILNLFWTQRSDVGRIYRTNLTNINKHTPFKEVILLSNLCQETALVTSALKDTESLYKIPNGTEDGEIALCFLASIVAGRVEQDDLGNINYDEYLNTAYQAAKFTDNTIDLCSYPFKAMEYTAKNRRSIGIGLTDVAHYMAKNGFKYDTIEGRNALHRLAELHSYALHKASVRLAKERGKCGWFDRTKYSDEKPWLPIDTYEKEVDKWHTQGLLCDWEGLRKEIKEYGVRFSVHEAFMPVESSSLFSGSTNGLYPVRETKLFKKSPKGTVYFEAPGADKYEYQNAYDIHPKDLAIVYAIFQKFCGQSISADFYQDLSGGKEASMADFYELDFFCHKLGIKTYYYLNTLTKPRKKDQVKAVVVTAEDEGCDSCTL